MELPTLVPVEYRGELVALVSERRVHIVAPWLLARPTGDPDLRFVAHMCLCCGEVLNGRQPGPFTSELAEAWARLALIDDDALRTIECMAEADGAARLNVPIEQLRHARRDWTAAKGDPAGRAEDTAPSRDAWP